MAESGSKEWFCRWDERFQIGPLNDEELLAMVAAGRIKATDQVRRGWIGPWFLVAQVPGLLAAVERRSASDSAQGISAPEPPPVSRSTATSSPPQPLGNRWSRAPKGRIAIALICLVLLALLGTGMFALSRLAGENGPSARTTAANRSAAAKPQGDISPPIAKAAPKESAGNPQVQEAVQKPPVSFAGRPYLLPKAQHGHSRAGVIWLWDVETGREIRSFRGHERHVVSVAFSADGSRLLSGARDGSARMWDVATGQELWKFQTDTPEVRTVVISPDGKTAVFSQADGEVLFVDAVSGRGLTQYRSTTPWAESHFTDLLADLKFSADGQSMIGASEYGPIGWWDVRTSEILFKSSNEHRHSIGANSLAVDFRADFKHVVAGGQGQIHYRDVQTTTVRQFHTVPFLKYPKARYGHDVYDTITAIALSDNGRLVLSGSERGKVRLWDVLSGKEIREFSGHDRLVTGIRFTPDQKRAITTSWDGSARLWDLEQPVEVRHYRSDTDIATCLAIAPDGQAFATGGGTTMDGVPRTPRFEAVLQKAEPRIVQQGLPGPTSLALDAQHDHVYWTHNSTICRSKMDGSELQELVTGLKHPSVLQLDLKLERMYWRVESSPYDEVHHARLDGSDHQVTRLDPRYQGHGRREVLGHAGTFEIEPLEGKIYFVSRPSRICRCNYDGSHVEDIVELGLSGIKIAVDGAGGNLYWAELGRGEIRRSNLDGSGVRTIYSHLGSGIHGIAFDSALQKVYWTETEFEKKGVEDRDFYIFNALCRANSDGSQQERLAVIDNDEPGNARYGFLIPKGKVFDVVDNDGMYARFNSPFTVDGQTGWLYWIKRETIERVRMYEPPMPAPVAAREAP